jgi:hypothetical protein
MIENNPVVLNDNGRHRLESKYKLKRMNVVFRTG